MVVFLFLTHKKEMWERRHDNILERLSRCIFLVFKNEEEESIET